MRILLNFTGSQRKCITRSIYCIDPENVGLKNFSLIFSNGGGLCHLPTSI